MLSIENSIGPLAYGGGVTLADWWDEKRITDGSITDKEILKKAGFLTYLGIGLPSLAMSAFNWMPKLAKWTGPLAISFLYGLPSFIYKTVKVMQAPASRTQSEAMKQAQEILRRKTEEARSGARTSGSRLEF